MKLPAVPFPKVCEAVGLPVPEAEYRLTSHRKFCWDFAWPDYHLVLEVQGGLFRKGGHSTGLGIIRDCSKLNCATALGWHTLQVTPATLTSPETLELLRWLLVGHTNYPGGLPALLGALPPQGPGTSRRVRTSGRATSRSRGRR